MTIMVKYAAPNVTRDVYASVRKAINWDADPPAGALLHLAAFDEAGGLQSVDLWDSRERLEAYLHDRFEPTVRKLGVVSPAPEIYEIAVAAASPDIDTFILPVFTPPRVSAPHHAIDLAAFQTSTPERPI
ncbi:hypothetical protein [Phenylobacterium sp.]|uniref:hypothetical protein n=1 Tax=Phenylobacterium sp. TaxID=1871053 RepID=UPI0035B1CFB5